MMRHATGKGKTLHKRCLPVRSAEARFCKRNLSPHLLLRGAQCRCNATDRSRNPFSGSIAQGMGTQASRLRGENHQEGGRGRSTQSRAHDVTVRCDDCRIIGLQMSPAVDPSREWNAMSGSVQSRTRNRTWSPDIVPLGSPASNHCRRSAQNVWSSALQCFTL